uniref:Uncharacterized protein n=1 Tax=Nelumbo nucifera TaxID=4432 RepID=A0A822ZCQ3_NELNU|nr:TPA_asm: hypothetical protein HUJ06_000530 [Nelumbo nucifera]
MTEEEWLVLAIFFVDCLVANPEFKNMNRAFLGLIFGQLKTLWYMMLRFLFLLNCLLQEVSFVVLRPSQQYLHVISSFLFNDISYFTLLSKGRKSTPSILTMLFRQSGPPTIGVLKNIEGEILLQFSGPIGIGDSICLKLSLFILSITVSEIISYSWP